MNKCYSEIIDNIPITRWCPFHDGKISIDNETMNDLDEDTRYTVLEWIKWRIVPAKKFNFHHSSYGIKHRLQEELNLYLTNNQFKHAMLMCGYLPKDENETNWIYAISDKSPCFHSENDKNYMLIVKAAKLKKARRLLKWAVEGFRKLGASLNNDGECDGDCLYCPINNHGNCLKWEYEDKVLALIGEDGDTND